MSLNGNIVATRYQNTSNEWLYMVSNFDKLKGGEAEKTNEHLFPLHFVVKQSVILNINFKVIIQ